MDSMIEEKGKEKEEEELLVRQRHLSLLSEYMGDVHVLHSRVPRGKDDDLSKIYDTRK